MAWAYLFIYNVREFSNDTESEALAVTMGKGVDGLFEKRRLNVSKVGESLILRGIHSGLFLDINLLTYLLTYLLTFVIQLLHLTAIRRLVHKDVNKLID